jgi:IS5 family transposase
LIGPDNKNQNLFADSAYKSAKTDGKLAELGITNYVHEKGRRNRPLNDLKKELNRLKSQVRCRIEHIFGCVENSMGGPEWSM